VCGNKWIFTVQRFYVVQNTIIYTKKRSRLELNYIYWKMSYNLWSEK
jgi:hypothetical protein